MVRQAVIVLCMLSLPTIYPQFPSLTLLLANWSDTEDYLKIAPGNLLKAVLTTMH